jgi:hypothetical protein
MPRFVFEFYVVSYRKKKLADREFFAKHHFMIVAYRNALFLATA